MSKISDYEAYINQILAVQRAEENNMGRQGKESEV